MIFQLMMCLADSSQAGLAATPRQMEGLVHQPGGLWLLFHTAPCSTCVAVSASARVHPRDRRDIFVRLAWVCRRPEQFEPGNNLTYLHLLPHIGLTQSAGQHAGTSPALLVVRHVSSGGLCGTRTRRLSAIAQQPFSFWLMTATKTRPHKPMLAEWTSDILSLPRACSAPFALISFAHSCLENWLTF